MRVDEIDFGYSRYNDREADLNELKFTLDDKPNTEWDRKFRSAFRIIANSKKINKVGVIGISISGDTGTVCYVSIHKSWRGTGLGQMLYDKAISECKKRGLECLYSDSSLSNDAHRAWARLAKRYNVEQNKGIYTIYLKVEK